MRHVRAGKTGEQDLGGHDRYVRIFSEGALRYFESRKARSTFKNFWEGTIMAYSVGGDDRYEKRQESSESIRDHAVTTDARKPRAGVCYDAYQQARPPTWLYTGGRNFGRWWA